MRQNTESDTYETYELKVPTFHNGKPEKFLHMMKDFKTTNYGTVTTPSTGRIQFLGTMLRGEVLIELYVLENQVGSRTNGHFKSIN